MFTVIEIVINDCSGLLRRNERVREDVVARDRALFFFIDAVAFVVAFLACVIDSSNMFYFSTAKS